ncbi:unnamed protein product [Penicillium egyptiacum]|uniref:NACHT domain-containing protein n=1 Tax=Penicillium egyptiacum TaxID=1303716 RepID=A0A9W4K9J8_9EURO|nr:unnamed protein product [Penicillium egyptiacum]
MTLIMASINFPGTNHALQIGNNYGTAEFHQSKTAEDIDRLWLHDLRCPDSLVVKNRLKETKDKLLLQSFEWVLKDPQYQSWRTGKDVCLLWIKGGAGKGKTMMSIGLIEELSRVQHESTVVTYFFCQNADNELNTRESIIKGWILSLVRQQADLKEILRRRWNTKKNRFNEDVASWRSLWNILLEMLDRCTASKMYMIVDALDECQDGGMVDFLKLIVRNGLDHPAKIKWLVTSRPLDSAERALLAGYDQVQVSLELNSNYVSEAVKAYITYKVDELSRYHGYREPLKREVETELSTKAEGTFLWVSLVCKRLENVRQDKALTTIQSLPPGLYPFYDRILNQLSEGHLDDVYKCIRLLKAMMLVYRPLKVEEVSGVTSMTNKDDAIKALVNRCASFLKMQENNIEFVHQSARDYLATENAQSILSSYERFGHFELVLGCLSHLSEWLKVNLIDLPRPDLARESSEPLKDKERCILLASLDYAATFWVQHLENINRRTIVQSEIIDKGAVGTFLHNKLLEWLECLSLLDRLPRAIAALEALVNITKDDLPTFALVQDATRFLVQHYHTLSHWPLQIHSSAVIFSPESSVVKRENLKRIPVYLRNVPLMEDNWASIIRTLKGHSGGVNAIAFFPDDKQLVSGSFDGTIKIWDTATGDRQKTLKDWVNIVAFSSDGKRIASESHDGTIKLWDTATGGFRKTLAGHLRRVTTVAFSPDGKQIALGGYDGFYDVTIKLWDTATGDLQKTLGGHSDRVTTVAFSPDGKQIASGSDDGAIKLWDTATGGLRKILAGHSKGVNTVAFSPDGKQIASGSHDKVLKLWDGVTGDFQKTLAGHSDIVTTVAFSIDGKQIASGSRDKTIKLWDAATGDFQKTLAGHLDMVTTVAFSIDGKQIASGSHDKTIKIWNTAADDFQKTLPSHSERVTTVAFSPDGKQIASGSYDGTIKLWDAATGGSQKTLPGHFRGVTTVVFSPDGKQIASGSYDGNIKLWDTLTGNFQKTLPGQFRGVTIIAFSPDGKQIASGSYDGTIRLWNTITGDLQRTLKGHSKEVNTVVFSPDGRQIASGSHDERIKIWDIPKSVKTPNLFRLHSSSRFKLRSSNETKTPGPVHDMNRYLATVIGPTTPRRIATDQQDGSQHSLQGLFIRDQWICYGEIPFFRLPSDFQPSSHDMQGDHVAIGFQNGHVLSFHIDRRILQSILGCAPSKIQQAT